MKIYLIVIKESGNLTGFYESYSTFEKAVNHLKSTAKCYSRILRETDLKNEFRVYADSGEYIHTLQIVDLWVR